MRNMLITSVAALISVVGTTTPAHASATAEEGKVGLSVTGTGLKVKRAGGWMDGHGRGVKARLYTVHQGKRYELTGWKNATPFKAGMTKISTVDWNWNKKPRKFFHGEWLCIEFNRTNGRPCAQIRR